ncbi:MAG: LysR substrate-binding domain-containing protein [Bacteroidales bacterium]|nr:LysR substrate-binding domain-containing protein [Bacteroidales bacterium]
MTLQQLEYVIAVADHGHFTKAAEACQITQSTLSSMLRKLEEELDMEIFDRSSHPVRPTVSGQSVVDQARIVVHNARKLLESTLSEGKRTTGTIKIAFAPTIAPYLVPQLIHDMSLLPELEFHASEVKRDNIIHQLLTGELDMGVCSIPHPVEGLLEIPIYHEELLLYVSEKDPLFGQEQIDLETLPYDRLWAIHNEYSFASDVFDNYAYKYARVPRYSSGNLPTLLRIVNLNDGFTILPELHLAMLREEDLGKTRPMNPRVSRQVSIFVREDYVRQGLVNIVVDAIKRIIPEEMLDPHIVQYPVRLR